MLVKVEDQVKKLAALTSVLLMAAAEAMAQEKGRPARRIVISIPDRKLAVVEADRVIRIFGTAVGAPNSPSPTGTFQIINQLTDPTWYTKGKVVPPGPANPLGTRWMGLSQKGYGIHGTNSPKSIGRNVSHGCIRMKNSDVEILYEIVSVGDVVELHGERTPELAEIFGTPADPATVVASAALSPTAMARVAALAAAPTATAKVAASVAASAPAATATATVAAPAPETALAVSVATSSPATASAATVVASLQ